MNIDEIRKQFPTPVRSSGVGNQSPERYCIGGAFFMCWRGIDLGCIASGGFLDPTTRFPSAERLAVALRQANPNLTMLMAEEYAESITDNNDDGAFDKAWDELDRALKQR